MRPLRVLNVIRATGIAGAERQLIDLLTRPEIWPGVAPELLVLAGPGLDLERLRAGTDGRLRVGVARMHADASPAVVRRLRGAFLDFDVVETHLVHADWRALAAARGRTAA